MAFLKFVNNKLRYFWALFISMMLVLSYVSYPAQAYDLEQHIGLYKVVETKCELTKGLYNPCSEIKFFELVKGRFFGIGPDDLAFVLWRSSLNEPDSSYEAGLVNNHKNLLMRDDKVWLSNAEDKTESVKEYFLLKGNKICGYHFRQTKTDKAGQRFFRDFYYKLIPASRSKIDKYNLEYPGHLPETQEALAYKDSSDSITKKVTIDQKLFTEFFNSNDASYKWYIIKNDDGTFEDTMNGEISKEDKIPMQHTSSCISTHQGKHSMNFCDANLKSGILQLKIHGGLPAYSSSLFIEVKENREFVCFFKAVYPALVSDLRWNILSKKLRLKTSDFKKGKQIFGWLSVEFEETSTYKGEEVAKNYKIEGFIKPIVK